MSDAHSVLGRYAPNDSPEPLIEVSLLNFPLQLFAQARERHDELVREFALVAMSPPQSRPGQHVPTRLLELIAALGQRYAGSADRADAVRDAALARGELSVDLHYKLPASAAPALDRLHQLTDDADTFCRSEQLLTLAATPLETRFRHWYLEQFTKQLEGGAATPWSGPLTDPDRF